MKRILSALNVAATMFASSASAFDPDDLQKLEDTNVCAQCDLTDANLMGADLNGAFSYLSHRPLLGGYDEHQTLS